MHEWAYSILEKVKENVESIGIENFCGQQLDDLRDFTSIAKNIAEADYYYNIVKAMEDSTYGEDYDENGKLYFHNKRDIDRKFGKMYYTEPEGKVDMAIMMIKSGKESGADDTANMKAVESMANALQDEMGGVLTMLTPAEKQFLKQRMTNLTNMI